MRINDTTYQIRGAIYNVYNELGPGLLENIYERAHIIELKSRGLKVENQVSINVVYKGIDLGLQYRIDILVEDTVVVELKSVETLLPVFHKQVANYLKLSDKPLGILVNFNTTDLNSNIIRIANSPHHPDLG